MVMGPRLLPDDELRYQSSDPMMQLQLQAARRQAGGAIGPRTSALAGAQKRVAPAPPSPEAPSGIGSSILGGLGSLLGGIAGFFATGGNPGGAAAGASLVGGAIGGGAKHAEQKKAVEEQNEWKRKYAPSQQQTPTPENPVPGMIASGVADIAMSQAMSGLTGQVSPAPSTSGTQAGFLEAQLPEGTSFSEQISLAKKFSDQQGIPMSELSLGNIYGQGKGFYEMPATAAQAATGAPSTVMISEGAYRGGTGPAAGGYGVSPMAAPPSLDETWIDDPDLAWQIAARRELAEQAAWQRANAEAKAAIEMALARDRVVMTPEGRGGSAGEERIGRLLDIDREGEPFVPADTQPWDRITAPRRPRDVGFTTPGTPMGLDRGSIQELIDSAPTIGSPAQQGAFIGPTFQGDAIDTLDQPRFAESVRLMELLEKLER